MRLQGYLLENENLTLWLLIKRVWKMCQQDKILPFSLRGSSDVNLKCSRQLPSPAQLLRIFTDYIWRRKEEDLRLYCCITTHSKKCKDSAGTDSSHILVHGNSNMLWEKEKKGWKTAAASFNPCSNPKEAENSVPNTVRHFWWTAIATDHLSTE